jgi:signal transduction histidine kinase
MSNSRSEARDSEGAYIDSTLLDIQELKNNLVSQIAHNFRTPLTSVLGFAEMLMDDRPLTDEQRVEYARFIQYEGIRLSKLIDDVLELSSLERGDAQLNLRNHAMEDVVSEAVTSVSEFARGRAVNIQKEFCASPIIARVDREKIVQATYQLLHNAVRFTKLDSPVVLGLRAEGQWTVISVKDSGPGISEDQIPTLFESMSRMWKSAPRGISMGVGLAIVKYIMDLHDGKIQVQSKVGEGSLFELLLPAVQKSVQ